MIGRSLIIFQLGNNKNEIHSVNPWELSLSSHEKDFDQKIIKQAKKKKWKPEEIINDAEVKAIVNATNCLDESQPGYHKWASDGVRVINRSGDPNLYNPANELAKKVQARQNKRAEALEKLKEYLPELVKLRNAIPVGPEMNDIVNCPHRKAYQDRCAELAELLGINATDVEKRLILSC